MDTTPTLTSSEVIDRVHAARANAHQAAVDEVLLAVQWALLHPCPAHEWPAHWGDPGLDEQVSPLAGVGAPLVAEFAPADLAAALGITTEAAQRLIGEGLELLFRLPRLWGHVVDGTVPVWRARLIAALAHDLGLEAVAYADRLISATPEKIWLIDAEKLVDEARLYYDPDRADADEEHELARRGVWVTHTGSPATTNVFMTLDTPDALLFDQTVTRIAAELRDLGDSDDVDVRRAKAVGVMADPQYALDLMSGREGAAPTVGVAAGALNLFVHLTSGDLDENSTGAATIEKLGAATTTLLQEWLASHAAAGGKVILRPVIDPTDSDTAATRPVDQHDPPTAMRELCLLRDAYCVFPGCRRYSRGCDLDHITAYIPMSEGGPPGQTNLLNLAPLCRRHHRVKTFTSWDYKRRDDGSYEWMSPTGHSYVVRPVSRRPPDRRR